MKQLAFYKIMIFISHFLKPVAYPSCIFETAQAVCNIRWIQFKYKQVSTQRTTSPVVSDRTIRQKNESECVLLVTVLTPFSIDNGRSFPKWIRVCVYDLGREECCIWLYFVNVEGVCNRHHSLTSWGKYFDTPRYSIHGMSKRLTR